MGHYYIDRVRDNTRIYFVVRSSDDSSIIAEPTKYLKHKLNQRRSPNTVRRLAYGLTFYLNYMDETRMTVREVLEMKYVEQHEHFTGFLNWLAHGNHCDRKKIANNNTCNSYLQTVFGYYLFLLIEYDHVGDLHVLERRSISYNTSAGVRFRRSVQAFQGYLPKQRSVGKAIEKGKIITLLEKCSCLRDQLILLLLAETGLRIGELLGIKYAEDIDYDNRTIRVEYRENNDNSARAKNAEYRRARVSDDTFDILLLYMAENEDLLSRSRYLFITLHGNTKGEPMTVNAVYSMLRTLEKATGIKTTPHQLRHYFANERRQVGWDLLQISTALGHRHLATTERYLNVNDDEMAEAMDEYFERNGGLYDIEKLI